MTVRQVMNMAKNSELNGISVANNDNVVLSWINLGMLELYKRFQLRVKEVIIGLETNVEMYTLPSDYMWVIAAYGEVDPQSGDVVNQLAINEEDNPLSINTVGWNTLQVPSSLPGAFVSIIYVASPDDISISDLDTPLDLPAQLVEALLAYVGFRGNSTIDAGVQTEDSVWYQRFENSCGRVKEFGMVNSDDMFMTNRINTRGFV